MKISWLFLIVILFSVALSSYFILQPNFQKKNAPAIIHVGILPDESVEGLHAKYDPLLNYLSAETGLKFKLVPSSDYRELVQLFAARKVDMAYFGGLTFIQSHELYNAEPLVMREVDTRFTSYFLVKNQGMTLALTDFKGKAFSFGSRLSTSGHLMPRHFLQLEKHIIPENFFTEVRFSGAHDKTAYLVRDGEVDLGVANAEIIKSMYQDGRLKKNDLHILWETPPYPDYVWAVQDDLTEELKTELRDAFLELDFNNEEQKKILTAIGTKVFLPAGISDFQPLQEIAKSLDLLKP